MRQPRRVLPVKKIYMLCMLSVIAILPLALFSADISGEWVIEQADKKGTVARSILEFSIEGNKVTGSLLGYQEDEWPILDGKLSGDKISFSIKQTAGNRTITNLYIGKIVGDTIEFTLTPINAGLGIPPRYKFKATKVTR